MAAVYSRLLAICAGEIPSRSSPSCPARRRPARMEEERLADRASGRITSGRDRPTAPSHARPVRPPARVVVAHGRDELPDRLLRAPRRAAETVTPYCDIAAYAVYPCRACWVRRMSSSLRPQPRTDACRGHVHVAVPVRLAYRAVCQLCRAVSGVQAQNRLAAAHKGYGLSEIMGDLSRTAWRALSHFTLSYQNFIPAAARASRAVRDALRRRYDQPASPCTS